MMSMSTPRIKRRKVETPNKSSLIGLLLRDGNRCQGFLKPEPGSAGGLTLDKGETLLPTGNTISWSPSLSTKDADEGARTLELKNFDRVAAQNGTGNNTVAIRFTAPDDSKRFSINIAGPNHDGFRSVLFHLNPRQFEQGGQMVLNDKKEGTWGQAINIPSSTLPLMFGQPLCTLIIQLSKDGFDVILNDKHVARLKHRQAIASGKNSLFLNLPATDDYGKPEKVDSHQRVVG